MIIRNIRIFHLWPQDPGSGSRSRLAPGNGTRAATGREKNWLLQQWLRQSTIALHCMVITRCTFHKHLTQRSLVNRQSQGTKRKFSTNNFHQFYVQSNALKLRFLHFPGFEAGAARLFFQDSELTHRLVSSSSAIQNYKQIGKQARCNKVHRAGYKALLMSKTFIN